MATLGQASSANKEKFTIDKIVAITDSLGVKLPEDHLIEWHNILASVQESIDVIDDLEDYVPAVDLEQYPRKNIHQPLPEDNDGNAWAWRFKIDGASEGPLLGMTVCLKDNIAVKDVPMLVGTDVFTDFIPEVDASMILHHLKRACT